MFQHCYRGLRDRVKKYDSLDWGLFGLTTAVVGTLLVLVYAAVNPEVKPWNALSYVIPAQVITEDNYIAESFSGTDEVPVRITRVTDCVNFDCPTGSLQTLVTVRWQLFEDGQEQTTVLTVLKDFETTLVEGQDYRIGENSINTTQLNPFPIPSEVIGHTAANGGSSTWRIEGTVVPHFANASPVPWQTQIFTVVA